MSAERRSRHNVVGAAVCVLLSQALCSSPFLDGRLFQYDEQALSCVIRYREAGRQPIRFVRQRDLHPPPWRRQHQQQQQPANGSLPAAADGAAAGASSSAQPPAAEPWGPAGAAGPCPAFQLQAAPSPTVTVQGQAFRRRMLHLAHPTDPFVVTAVQTFAQPTLLNIAYRAEQAPAARQALPAAAMDVDAG